jgi:hypothetical protein
MLRRRTRAGCCICIVAAAVATPALAGPPYVSDDPQPTDFQHYEIYAYTQGTAAAGGTVGQGGIDFNYGAAPDLQLTAVLPPGFATAPGTPATAGLGNVQLAAKYRFLHQDSFGFDVSVFPRLFLPASATAVGDVEPSLLLPIWVQKDFGANWSTFGGGGCVVSARQSHDICLTGAVLAYQVLPKLQLGVEAYYQTADGIGTPASASLGLGARYDLDDTYHLLGYVRQGVLNAAETDRISWYAAVLFTF